MASPCGVARINPFIATLATGIVFGGIVLIISGEQLITVNDPSFQTFGSTEFLGVRLTTWIFIAFALVMGLLLQRTKFGRYIYACGGNEEAARLSGIRVGTVRIWVFVLSGLAATMAGALFAARVGVGDSSVGNALTLQAVAAIVVGGTSIWGGEGAIWRTIVGLFSSLSSTTDSTCSASEHQVPADRPRDDHSGSGWCGCVHVGSDGDELLAHGDMSPEVPPRSHS